MVYHLSSISVTFRLGHFSCNKRFSRYQRLVVVCDAQKPFISLLLHKFISSHFCGGIYMNRVGMASNLTLICVCWYMSNNCPCKRYFYTYKLPWFPSASLAAALEPPLDEDEAVLLILLQLFFTTMRTNATDRRIISLIHLFRFLTSTGTLNSDPP